MPALVPVHLRLLAGAGHQEDVVVDPQRHQEHEADQQARRGRCPGSRRRARTASARDADGRGDRSARRSRPAAAAPRPRAAAAPGRSVITSSTSGTMTAQVAGGGLLGVQVAAPSSRRPAPRRSTARTAVRRSATVACAAALSGASARVASSRTSPSTTTGAPRPRRGGRLPVYGTTVGHAVRRRAAASATSCQPSAGVMMLGRAAPRRRRSAGPGPPAPPPTCGAAAHRLRQRDAAAVERGHERGEDEQPHQASRPARGPAGGRPLATRAQPRPLPLLVAVPRAGTARTPPGRTAPARPAGRSARRAWRSAMLTAEIGPSPRLEPRSENSRQSTPRITVPPLATIGSHDCSQRHPHRGVAVDSLQAQFLPEPGHQQQAVVGGRAHDQDRGDPLALAVDRDPAALGQQVGDRQRAASARPAVPMTRNGSIGLR